jgi:gas vesicle protein
MANENKLVAGILVGALVGAAFSLFDRNTREDVVACGKNASAKIKGYIQEPTLFTNEVKQKIEDVKDTFQEVSDDITFINEKVNELKETTPQVVNLLKESKERFISKQ